MRANERTMSMRHFLLAVAFGVACGHMAIAQVPHVYKAEIIKSFPNSLRIDGFEFDDSPAHAIPLICFDSSGKIILIDSVSKQIKFFDEDFSFVRATPGDSPSLFWFSDAFYFFSDSSILGVALREVTRLIVFSSAGHETKSLELPRDTEVLGVYDEHVLAKNSATLKLTVLDRHLSIVGAQEARRFLDNLLFSNDFSQDATYGPKIAQMAEERRLIVAGDRILDIANSSIISFLEYQSIVKPGGYDKLGPLQYVRTRGQLLGFDSQENSYWSLMWVGDRSRPTIYIFSKAGDLVDCFTTDIFISGMLPSPSGDLYQILRDNSKRCYNMYRIHSLRTPPTK